MESENENDCKCLPHAKYIHSLCKDAALSCLYVFGCVCNCAHLFIIIYVCVYLFYLCVEGPKQGAMGQI